jgi:hypothetical protein
MSLTRVLYAILIVMSLWISSSGFAASPTYETGHTFGLTPNIPGPFEATWSSFTHAWVEEIPGRRIFSVTPLPQPSNFDPFGSELQNSVGSCD